ncbi:hypothetical protein [Paenibacillus sp. NAIST15-1]|uniref:hypothetical protein n=1 Tax=Paenibacillus sp. NAIST15-1 TaxID=1605994 RepID=UPI00086B58A4|nr:hypothetical protein [Paenibacillus sp. NAIST15-1]GAV11505.1 hypothetical protein PBN151_1434 [Paenibacillus sp. NAIST15-1]
MSKSKTNEGKVFEKNWAESYAKLPIYYLRLVDAVKWTRGGDSSFTPSNPFDALQFKSPFLFLLELKSTSGTSMSFNPNKPDEKPENNKSQLMLKPHQVKALMKAIETEGIISGFIINFREKKMKTIHHPHETYFIHINDFMKFAIESGRSSISREGCREIGLYIGATLKKVNYKYHVDEFINEALIKYVKAGYISEEFLTRTHQQIEELLIHV